MTLKVTVFGDTYDEIVARAEQEISDFLEIDIEEVSSRANYEILVARSEEMSSDSDYQAEVIARIR